MAWETRNHRSYYYRSHRSGDRVFKEYIGSGPVAEAIATLDRLDRRDRVNARDEAQHSRQETEAINDLVQMYYDQVEEQMRDALLAAGYHRPKRGQWRKRRNENR